MCFQANYILIETPLLSTTVSVMRTLYHLIYTTIARIIVNIEIE